MNTRRLFLALTTAALALPAAAQTAASGAWVRGTVAGQQSTGAFLTLTSPTGGRLVQASAGDLAMVEIHEMAMDGNVMRMRQIEGITLPAGQAVALKPGSLHLMLMGLKAPLKAGSSVPLTLVIEGPGGKKETLQVKAEVRALGAGGH